MSTASPRRSFAPVPAPIGHTRQRRLISLNEVSARTGFSRWWVREAVLAGRFPRPVSTGTRTPRWVESEVDDFIDRLIAERDAKTAG